MDALGQRCKNLHVTIPVQKLHAAMQSISVKHFLGAYLADTMLGTVCS